MQYHKYSLTEIEDLMPWERDVYTALLRQHLEELKKDLTSKPILLHRIQRTNDRWASSFEGINCMKLDRPEVDAVLLDLAAMEGIRHQILECTPSAQPLYIKRDV